MSAGDPAYHARRATMQRRLAELATDPAAIRAHAALAELHEGKVRAGRVRPVLRMVVPG